MNVERLKQFLNLLISKENQFDLQNSLSNLSSLLNNLQNEPQSASHQTAVGQHLIDLDTALRSLYDNLTPAQQGLLSELGGNQYFSPSISSDIKQMMSENSITPAVVANHVRRLVQERQNYIKYLDTTNTGLSALGVREEILEEGKAEIGFLIPRDLFKNNFGELIKELTAINRIIRIFSEVATGADQVVEVHQISSTDPTFFLGLDAETIAEIGGTITWLLHTWKEALKIKKAIIYLTPQAP